MSFNFWSGRTRGDPQAWRFRVAALERGCDPADWMPVDIWTADRLTTRVEWPDGSALAIPMWTPADGLDEADVLELCARMMRHPNTEGYVTPQIGVHLDRIGDGLHALGRLRPPPKRPIWSIPAVSMPEPIGRRYGI